MTNDFHTQSILLEWLQRQLFCTALCPAATELTDRKKVNFSQNNELYYIAEKTGVSIQQVTGAKLATGSNDRKTLKQYINDKKNGGSKKK